MPDKIPAVLSRGSILFNQGSYEDALGIFDGYNTKQSRACALETLYALGRFEDIYQRIDAQSVLDEDNLASDSATQLATQQSIKAYVDGQSSTYTLTVKEINDPSANVNVASVSQIQFDVASGFALTDLTGGVIKVAMESTFKKWNDHYIPHAKWQIAKSENRPRETICFPCQMGVRRVQSRQMLLKCYIFHSARRVESQSGNV